MSLVIGCANPECKQPFSFMLDEKLGGARCPYCGEVSALVAGEGAHNMERTSVLVQENAHGNDSVSEL